MACATDPTDDDLVAFRRAMSDVVRLVHDRAEVPGVRPPPVPAQTYAEERDVIREALRGSVDPA